jgi:transglutaminase-like putative cysteine protease
MHASDLPQPPPGMMTLRAGCMLSYIARGEVPLLLLIRPRLEAQQILLQEASTHSPAQPAEHFADSHGNTFIRTMLAPGVNVIRHDMLLLVPNRDENQGLPTDLASPAALPPDVLRYTFASRYCESDRLAQFAHERFDHLRDNPAQMVEAICSWTHANIEYRYGTGSSLLSAGDILARGYGVCRDYAHVMVALCRAMDIPARYAAGYLPYLDPHTAEGDMGVDFHAYCEVYLGGHWHIYDPRYNRTHKGRIKIAHGMDAVDCAFATFYGEVVLDGFQVWAYDIGGRDEHAGGPVAMVRGADGSAVLVGR